MSNTPPKGRCAPAQRQALFANAETRRSVAETNPLVTGAPLIPTEAPREYFGSPAALRLSARDIEVRREDTGDVVYKQDNVLCPDHWSDRACQIAATKYFHGAGEDREKSIPGLIHRVVQALRETADQLMCQPRAAEYWAELRAIWADDLWQILFGQLAAFNSPVWFNFGLEGVRQQGSACYITDVEDSIESICDWIKTEMLVFRSGSGSGCNLSKLRGKNEGLSGGGHASGPMSFERVADVAAGTMESGGRTRRAAKGFWLDDDHPDLLDFIQCKVVEEEKARALQAAGFDCRFDGEAEHNVLYQNANNSVRVSDEFMEKATDSNIRDNWILRNRTDSEVASTHEAKNILRAIAEAAHQCGDPGLQFKDRATEWHCSPGTGPIPGANPCSEFVYVANSSCNLASINLGALLDLVVERPSGLLSEDNEWFKQFIRDLRYVAATMTLALELVVERGEHPTPEIDRVTETHRPIGLGITGLGEFLLRLGLPYDSPEARDVAAGIQALVHAQASLTSNVLAGLLGPYPASNVDDDFCYLSREQRAENAKAHSAIHQKHARGCSARLVAAKRSLSKEKAAFATDNGRKLAVALLRAADAVFYRVDYSDGFRNGQMTVIAPAGTISFMLDAETTGCEPVLAHRQTKRLVGGGSMEIVSEAARTAVRQLEAWDVVNHIDARELEDDLYAYGYAVRGRFPAHLCALFETAFASHPDAQTIPPAGHLQMLAALQPFVSGAISKTVNLPNSATVEDVLEVYGSAWKLGLKSISVYRDGCKNDQPVAATVAALAAEPPQDQPSILQHILPPLTLPDAASVAPKREKLTTTRSALTHRFSIAGQEGYLTLGLYPDGRPGELFIRMSKQGSTISGLLDSFAIAISLLLQVGVDPQHLIDKFSHTRFDPAGVTDNPDIRMAHSVIDYVFRWLAKYIEGPSIRSYALAVDPAMPGTDQTAVHARTTLGSNLLPIYGPKESTASLKPTGQSCSECGGQMYRVGACPVCLTCGHTTGCS